MAQGFARAAGALEARQKRRGRVDEGQGRVGNVEDGASSPRRSRRRRWQVGSRAAPCGGTEVAERAERSKLATALAALARALDATGYPCMCIGGIAAIAQRRPLHDDGHRRRNARRRHRRRVAPSSSYSPGIVVVPFKAS